MKRFMITATSLALLTGALAQTAAAQGSYRRAPHGRSRTAVPVAVGAAAGAGVGALAGGKRGAVIGGLIGAGGGYVYSRRNRDRHYRQPYYGPQQPYYGGGGRAHSSAGRYYGGYNGYPHRRVGPRHDGSRSYRGY